MFAPIPSTAEAFWPQGQEHYATPLTALPLGSRSLGQRQGVWGLPGKKAVLHSSGFLEPPFLIPREAWEEGAKWGERELKHQLKCQDDL